MNPTKRKWMETKVKNQRQGQALIEFVLGLMVIFSFFFFFIRMSALFAIANYIHYATFMAARAYSSGTTAPDAREENATEVLERTIKGKFKSLIRADEPTIGAGQYYVENSKTDFWNQGVSFPFQASLSLHPFTPKNQSIRMELASESWMPTNPNESETESKRQAIEAKVGAKVTNAKVWWDNGR